jgi:hypothetical protein
MAFPFPSGDPPLHRNEANAGPPSLPSVPPKPDCRSGRNGPRAGWGDSRRHGG